MPVELKQATAYAHTALPLPKNESKMSERFMLLILFLSL
jgi:hypothetical protein